MSTPQLPLGLRAPPDQRLEAFLGNDAARAAMQAAATGASRCESVRTMTESSAP